MCEKLLLDTHNIILVIIFIISVVMTHEHQLPCCNDAVFCGEQWLFHLRYMQQTSASRYRPPIQPTDPLTLLDHRSAQSGEGRRGFGSGKVCHLVAGTFFLDLVYMAILVEVNMKNEITKTTMEGYG